MSRARRSAAIVAAMACLGLAAPAHADTTSILAPDMEVDVGDAGDLGAAFTSTGFNSVLPGGRVGLQVDVPGSPGTVVGIGALDPGQQGSVTGSGTAADPYSVLTTYQAAGLAVEQTVTHVTGDPQVRVHLVLTNSSTAPLHVLEWGEVQGGGFGQGTGAFSAGYLAGVFATQGSATGLQRITPWDHYEEADDATLSDTLEDPNAQLTDTVDAGAPHDPAVAAEYTVPPGPPETVDLAWRFSPGAANLQLDPGDGAGPPARPACFTATVTNAYGAAVPAVPVDFFAGDPHPDLEAPTDGAGHASYCVSAAAPDEQLFVEADVTDASLSGFSTWTFTGPSSGSAGAGAAPPPVAGRTVRARLVKGAVRIRHGGNWTALTGTRTVKVGTMLDARHGTVAITGVVGRRSQRAAFSAGMFKIRQANAGAPIQAVLAGASFGSCRAGSAQVVRRLHATARGRWQTVARQSVATVTKSAGWATRDRCDGTLTTVQTGALTLRSAHRPRTVMVRAHHHVLTRGQRRVSTTTGISRSVLVWYSS